MQPSRIRSLLAPVLAALAIAAIALVAQMLSFFVGNGQDPAVLTQVYAFYWTAAIYLFVLLAIFGLVGAFSRWYTALIAGAISGILAALVGTAVPYLVAGTPFGDEQLTAYLWSSVFGVNLFFWGAAVLASVTLGRTIYRAVVGEHEEDVESLAGTVLVRRPASSLAEGEVTHIERSDIDLDLAEEQWEKYVSALIGSGWEPVEVKVAESQPDSVFVEDAVVMFEDLAVITRPGVESRRGEARGVKEAVAKLGLATEEILAPGTLEGGDVLKVGKTVYVGRGGRTNVDGIRQLRQLLAPRGYSVVAVPTSKVLHLKSAVTALPDGTVIGFPDLVDDALVFDRFMPMPEPEGSHVVILSDDTVLISSAAPQSAALIESLGYRVISIDISEFEKLEGCVTCLSVRIR